MQLSTYVWENYLEQLFEQKSKETTGGLRFLHHEGN